MILEEPLRNQEKTSAFITAVIIMQWMIASIAIIISRAAQDTTQEARRAAEAVQAAVRAVEAARVQAHHIHLVVLHHLQVVRRAAIQ